MLWFNVQGLGPFRVDVATKFQQLDSRIGYSNFVGDLVNRDGIWTLVQVATLLFGF
jgi:hypothetical protein